MPLLKAAGSIVAAVFGIVGLLALASYMAGGEIWDGGFPSGEFRIHIRDPDGRPISGAVLRVYYGGTRELACGNPLENHQTGVELVSDENGRITVVQTRTTTQFGGYKWRLFWIIPMGTKAPEYDCETTAAEFRPAKFPVWKIFESAFESPTAIQGSLRDQDGNLMRIYERTITLERDDGQMDVR